jgi:Tfp pilus assembly protein PilP
MKLGTENKNKTIVALVLAGLALIFVVRWIFTSETSTATTTPPKAAVVAEQATAQDSHPKRPASQRSDQKTLATTWKPSLDPRLELKSLESSEAIEYKGTGRNIFQMTAEPAIVIPDPKANGRIDKQPTVTPVYTPPPPPPINLKFYGFATKSGGQKSVFLSQEGSVFVAKEGDIIARRYKVVRINATSVEIQDLLSNNKQTIPLTAG